MLMKGGFMGDFKVSIKAARVNAELTQAQASEQAYMSLTRLKRIESGETEMSVNEAIKLCKIYGCGLSDVKL